MAIRYEIRSDQRRNIWRRLTMNLSYNTGLLLLFFNIAALQAVEYGVIDMKTLEKVESPFLTFGGGIISTEYWTTMSTGADFYANGENSTVVLMSLPDIGGDTSEQGVATAIRIRNKAFNEATRAVSFEARMYQPNDSYCVKTWFVPQPIPSLEITFIVAEKGAYLLRDIYPFFVGVEDINRTTGSLINDTINWFWFEFDKGCTYGWNDPAEPCQFNKTQLVNEIGVMATLQTLVHDTYLLLRVHKTQRTRIGVILTPHDSLDPNYFTLFGEHEKAGYVAYPTGMALVCLEGVQFETKVFFPITSEKFIFPYVNTYPFDAPAVFGMLTTQNSLTDSTSIRVFNRTKTSSFAITQEDQCATEQVTHTTPERVTMFIFAPVPAGSGEYCFSNPSPSSIPTSAPTTAPTTNPTRQPTTAPTTNPSRQPTTAPTTNPTESPTANPTESPTEKPTNQDPTACPSSSAPTFAPSANPTINPTNFPTHAPTPTPTLSPTVGEYNRTCVYEILTMDMFGDGWVNVDLNVTVNSKSTYHHLNCSCDVLNITAKGCNIDIKATSYGEEPITPWEVYWQVKVDGTYWYGDFDSRLVVENDEVTLYENMLNPDPTNTKNQCKECRHPKPPPKPSPASPNGSDKEGSGGGSKSDDDNGGGGDKTGKDPSPSGKPPPRPPVSVEIDLFDEVKNGWYVSTGETDWCDADEHGAKGPIPAPDVFTYPRYYVMNRDRTKLIKTGTICKDNRGTEHCVDMLPFHGDFVWRVAGFEKTWEGEQAEWHFCGNYGGLGHELEFKMRGGECIPGGRLTADMYCQHGFESLVGFTGTLVLSGLPLSDDVVSNTFQGQSSLSQPVEVLSQRDTIFFEREISQMFFDSHPVTITAVSVLSDDSIAVTITSTLLAEEHGLDGSDMSLVDTLTSEVQSALEKSFAAGAFVSILQHDLSLRPATADDLFSHASGLKVQLQSLEVTAVEFIPKGSYTAAHKDSSTSGGDEDSLSASTNSVTSSLALHSTGKIALVVFVVGVATLVALVTVRSLHSNRDVRGDHDLLPLNSAHQTSTPDSLPPVASRIMSPDECDQMDMESSHGSRTMFTWEST